MLTARKENKAAGIRTVADMLDRLGGVSPDRIRFRPAPGTATVDDVVRIREQEGCLCELIAGILVEKPVGLKASRLAGYLIGLLNLFVIPRNLGFVTAPDGGMELLAGLVRIPDVAFVSWDRTPGGVMPATPVPRLVPDLAVEVLSDTNTPREMETKRGEYFNAGVSLVWEIDPEKRTVVVYTTPTDGVQLSSADVLDGGTVLPGFHVVLADFFAELDRGR
jgi:Uma2 family endonuclease